LPRLSGSRSHLRSRRKKRSPKPPRRSLYVLALHAKRALTRFVIQNAAAKPKAKAAANKKKEESSEEESESESEEDEKPKPAAKSVS
jgi:hypothetical protein